MQLRHTRSQRGADAAEPEPTPAAAPVKRGRGRPRGSKSKPKNTGGGERESGAANAPMAVPEDAAADAPAETPVKRGRGRPRGSKTRPKAEAASQPDPEPEPPAKRGRGRPRGSTNGPRRVQTRLAFSSPRSSSRTGRRRSGNASDEFEPAGDQDDDDDDNFVADGSDDDGQDSAGTADTGFSEESATRSRPKRAKTRGAAAPAMRATAPRARTRGKYKRGGWTPRRAWVAAMWLGPQQGQPRVNTSYIDVGLDEATWAALRGLRVDRERIDVETAPGVLCAHMPLAGPHSGGSQGAVGGAVCVTMADGSGTADSEQPLRIEPLQAQRLVGQTPGWIANAAELVMAVDWAPVAPTEAGAASVDYIAVGGLGPGSTAATEPVMTRRVRSAVPGHIQIWRLEVDTQSQASTLRLDMAILHSFGHCTALRWCPIGTQHGAADGAQVPTVGILAVAFGDGVLRVCAVPAADALRPQQTAASSGGAAADPVCFRWPQQSLVEVRAGKGVFTAVEWASSDVLAAGTSSGVLQAWHVGAAVRGLSSAGGGDDDGAQGIAALVPMVSHQLHAGPILTTAVYRSGVESGLPFDDRRTADGFRQIGLADIQLITLGVDGRLRQTSLLFPTRLGAPLQSLSRPTPACCAYWPLGTCIFSDVDKYLRRIKSSVLADPADPWLQSVVRPDGGGGDTDDESARWNQMFDRSSMTTVPLECPTQQVAASDLHTYIAVAKSSGELAIANMEHRKTSHTFAPQQRVIYSLLGDAGGEEADDGPAGRRFVCSGRQAPQARPLGDIRKSTRYRLHLPEVAVRACAWSRNPRTSTWIASATASGIVRIEDVAP